MKTIICTILFTVLTIHRGFAVIERFHNQKSEHLNRQAIIFLLGADYTEGIKELRIAASPELAGPNALNQEQAEAAANKLTEQLHHKSIPHTQALWMLLRIGEPETVRRVTELFNEFESEPGLKYQPIHYILSSGASAQLKNDSGRWNAIKGSGSPLLLKPFTKKLLSAKLDAKIWREMTFSGEYYWAYEPHVTSAEFTMDLLIAGDGIPESVKDWAKEVKQKAKQIFESAYPRTGDMTESLRSVVSNMRRFAELNKANIESGSFGDLRIPPDAPQVSNDRDVKQEELPPQGKNPDQQSSTKERGERASDDWSWWMAGGVFTVLLVVSIIVWRVRRR